MKVTFTCEKCGYSWEPNCIRSGHDGNIAEYSFLTDDCPNCAALTYGPLTEEMVAEALYSISLADGVDYDIAWAEAVQRAESENYWLSTVELYRKEARFVLRLLRELGSWDGCPEGGWPVGRFLSEWLLELAREKPCVTALKRGDKAIFPEGNDLFYGQDHGFWRGVPSGRPFTVESVWGEEDLGLSNRCKLTAEGYGERGSYGNGAIYMDVKDVLPYVVR
jgi:hypothetical protein